MTRRNRRYVIANGEIQVMPMRRAVRTSRAGGGVPSNGCLKVGFGEDLDLIGLESPADSLGNARIDAET
jgi:hypothetical protein